MTSSSALRLATWLVAAVSVGFPALCLVYLLSGRLDIAVIVLTSLAAVGVPHFLNMRAALRGVRPPLFPLTIILQAVFTYLPDPYLPSGLSGLTAQLLACTLLIFVPLWASVPLVGLMAGLQFAAIMTSLPVPVIAALYALTIPVVGIMVAAVVRLALVTGALEEARAELAEAAVLKERLRISRDLHDGLGHSLTAIALKGDLAGRLIDRDPGTARSEVGDLVKVAREAAQEVRQVARGYREISLSGETQRAVALLEASGVAAQAHLAPGALPRPSEEALAWGCARASPTCCATAGRRRARSRRRSGRGRCGWRSSTTGPAARRPARPAAVWPDCASGPPRPGATRRRARWRRGRSCWSWRFQR